MITLVCGFWLFLTIFGLIGVVRGWAKELLVSASVLVALSILTVLTKILPRIPEMINSNPDLAFWLAVGIVSVMVFFGYMSPKLPLLGKSSARRDQISDFILGLFMGLVSGYMVIGTLWYFLHQHGYYVPYILPPPNDELGQAAQGYIKFLPPAYLMSNPWLVIGVTVVMFVFVLIVFI